MAGKAEVKKFKIDGLKRYQFGSEEKLAKAKIIEADDPKSSNGNRWLMATVENLSTGEVIGCNALTLSKGVSFEKGEVLVELNKEFDNLVINSK